MTLALGAVTAAALLYLTQVVIGVTGWEARYWIPLGGMLLGNAMTAAVLAVERLGSEINATRRDVEAMLCMGASPAQATHGPFRRAIAAAMTPTLNAMMIVGVVKLPGMMTGQMLGGSQPMQAAMYQLLILVGILTCDMLAATAMAWLMRRRYFTPAEQLDVAMLTRPSSSRANRR
jgi:putative ABC transport system permease protein